MDASRRLPPGWLPLNPILNSAYREPARYYATDAAGNLDYATVVPGRRPFGAESRAAATGPAGRARDTLPDAHLINALRRVVGQWRAAGYPDTTRVSRQLLGHWFPDQAKARPPRLFFAQQEAIETAVWLNEVAGQSGAGNQLLAQLRTAQLASHAPGPLPRLAFALAPGTGRTAVVAALLLYHYFNRRRYRHDPRFAASFLLVAAGRASHDRLRQLRLDPATERSQAPHYYQRHQLVPPAYEEQLDGLSDSLVIVRAWELAPGPLTGPPGPQPRPSEDYGSFFRRLLPGCRVGSRVLVLNDDAHPSPQLPAASTGPGAREDARADAWLGTLHELAGRYQLVALYNFPTSAGLLPTADAPATRPLPWTITSFGLAEAIESGLVKIPCLLPPEDGPPLTSAVLRHLYDYVSADLGRAALATGPSPRDGGPALPPVLLRALDQLVAHYQAHDHGPAEPDQPQPARLSAPPVLVVLCHDAALTTRLYQHLAGYEYDGPHGRRVAVGAYHVFSNYWPDGSPRHRPPTLLVDSPTLENDGLPPDEFRRVRREVLHQLRQAYHRLHPGRADDLTDAALLREAVGTVGKPGRLGAPVRCVVTVDALPDGWCAGTVTHLLSLRAPDAPGLAEQVVSRALRRRRYDLLAYDKHGAPLPDRPRSKARIAEYRLAPEYACVVGLPLGVLWPGPEPLDCAPTPIRALPERAHLEIRFPNLTGYRQELAADGLRPDFGAVSTFELDFAQVATQPELAATFAGKLEHVLTEQPEQMRATETVYHLTCNVLRHHFTDASGGPQVRYFGPLRRLVAQWYHECLTLRPHTDPAFKWLVRYWDAAAVAGHISQALVLGLPTGACPVHPVLWPYHAHGSTCFVRGRTARPVFATTKSHVNYVAAAPQSAEYQCTEVLEELPAVLCYASTAFLNFRIPYLDAGRPGNYCPAFLARVRTPRGQTANLLIELATPGHDQRAPRLYTEKYWLPAVNRDLASLGLPPDEPWAFVELSGTAPQLRDQLTQKIRELA